MSEQPDHFADEAIEAAWIEELNRRDADLASGEEPCYPADEVFAELRRKHAARLP